MRHNQRQDLITETEKSVLVIALVNIFVGLIGILSAAFVLLQLPFFNITFFNGQSAVYAALIGSIIFIFSFCYIRRDVFSLLDSFIFSAYLIWVFLAVLFFKNIFGEEVIKNNIWNLVIGGISLCIAFYGANKYWTQDQTKNF